MTTLFSSPAPRRWTLGVLALALCAPMLGGCETLALISEKKDLRVETRLSEAVFLDPIPQAMRVVYLESRNQTGSSFDQNIVKAHIQSAMEAAGWRITSTSTEARLWVQVNLRHFGRTNPDQLDTFLASAATSGSSEARERRQSDATSAALVGASAGFFGNDDNEGALFAGGAIAGLAVGTYLANKYRDIAYGAVMDIRITDRDQKKQVETSAWSFANKVNLEEREAVSAIMQDIGRAMAGIF